MADNRRVSEKSLTAVVSVPGILANPLLRNSDESTTVMLSAGGNRIADNILAGVSPMVRTSVEGVLVADNILTNEESVMVVVSVDGTLGLLSDLVRDASATVTVSVDGPVRSRFHPG